MKTPTAVTVVVLLVVFAGIKGRKSGFFSRFGAAMSGTYSVNGSGA